MQLVLEAREREETAAIACAPVPWVGSKLAGAATDVAGRVDSGVWSRKALTSVGLKLHGVVMGFVFTGASRYDTQAVVELLDSFAHHLKRLLGDSASNNAALPTFLLTYHSGALFVSVKVNQLPGRCKSHCTCPNILRNVPGACSPGRLLNSRLIV